eukprot:scaffold58545_cov18-Tisochrysis_lutea.AAC.1
MGNDPLGWVVRYSTPVLVVCLFGTWSLCARAGLAWWLLLIRGRSSNKRVSVTPQNPGVGSSHWHYLAPVMELYAKHRAVLELEYFGE